MGNDILDQNPAVQNPSAPDEVGVLSEVLSKLAPLPPDARARLLQTVLTFFGLDATPSLGLKEPSQLRDVQAPGPGTGFAGHPDLSPKEFVLQKEPRTDAERVTCLAYYLTHFRGEPHFRTIELTKLNTEAAHAKFSNPAVAVEAAVRRGFLVPAPGGTRQLGALGERFVQALPDREAAKAVLERVRSRRAGKAKRSGEATVDNGDSDAQPSEKAD